MAKKTAIGIDLGILAAMESTCWTWVAWEIFGGRLKKKFQDHIVGPINPITIYSHPLLDNDGK